MLEELSDDRIEFVSMLPYEPPRFRVTLLGDSPDLVIDGIE